MESIEKKILEEKKVWWKLPPKIGESRKMSKFGPLKTLWTHSKKSILHPKKGVL
jgi:hypothetical protein